MLSYKRFKTALIKKSFTYEQARELLSDKSNWYLVYQMVNDSEIVPGIDFDPTTTFTYRKHTTLFVEYFLRLPFGLTSFYNMATYTAHEFFDNQNEEFLSFKNMPTEEQHRLFNQEVLSYGNPTMYVDTVPLPVAIKQLMNTDYPAETAFLVENALYLGRNPTNQKFKTYCVINRDASKPDVRIYAEETELVSRYGLSWDSRYNFSQFIAEETIPGSEVSTTTLVQSHFFDNKIIKELPGGVIKYRDRFGTAYTTLNVASIVTANSRTLNQVRDTYIHGIGFHVLGSLSNGNVFVIRTTDFSTWSFEEQGAASAEILSAYGDENATKMKQIRNTKIGEQIVNMRECYTLNGTTWNVLPVHAEYPNRQDVFLMHGGNGKFYVSNTEDIYETTDFTSFKIMDGGFYGVAVPDITPTNFETNSGVSVKGFDLDGTNVTLPTVYTEDAQLYGSLEYYDVQEDVTINTPAAVLIHDEMVIPFPHSISLGGI